MILEARKLELRRAGRVEARPRDWRVWTSGSYRLAVCLCSINVICFDVFMCVINPGICGKGARLLVFLDQAGRPAWFFFHLTLSPLGCIVCLFVCLLLEDVLMQGGCQGYFLAVCQHQNFDRVRRYDNII